MKSNDVKRFLTNLFTNNIGYKILSGVVAVLVWIIVINIADPVTTRTFNGLPVEVINQSAISSINQVYEIIDGETVDFVVKGKVSVVRNLRISDFHAYADLSQLSPVYATDIVVKCDKENVEVEPKNKRLLVKLEDIDTRNVQVAVETIGDVAEGYSVGDYEVKPNMITVTGGKSKIKQIDTIKVQVNIDGAKKSFSDRFEPVAYDKDGKIIDSSCFTFSNGSTKISDVYVDITVFKTKVVPVIIKVSGTPAEGYVYKDEYEYTPESIEVSGRPSKIKEMDSIEIPVDITDMKEDYETNISLSDYLPEGVKTVNSEESISVRVKLESLMSKTISFMYEDIDIRNIPKNCKVKQNDAAEVYTVKVNGTEDIVSEMDADKLKPYIDLKDLGEGNVYIDIRFEGIEADKLSDIPKIGLNISKNADEDGAGTEAIASPEPETEPEASPETTEDNNQ